MTATMTTNKTNATTSTGAGAASTATTVFNSEVEMMRQLAAMGMPRQMLENLTDQQKRAMFALTTSPEIQRRAEERVAHEDEWKAEKQSDCSHGGSKEFMWKNTRDDVFCKFTLPSSTKRDQIQCAITSNHLKIVVVVTGENSNNEGGNKNDQNQDVVLVDSELFQTVVAEESEYKVELEQDNSVVVVSLRKKQIPMRWLTVFR